MGQISVPSLNRTGYSMYWNSMWDDKHNYTRNLKEDIFIKRFMPLFFEDSISSFLLTSNIIKKKFNNQNYEIFIKPDQNLNEFKNYIIDLNKSPLYFSKSWILKYQTWVIIYFFVYSFSFNKLLNKNSVYIDDSIFNPEIDILSNYYYTLTLSNYDFTFFKKFIYKKYEF